MARQITLELLADSARFESGMKNAAKAADAGAEKIEAAAKKADRMSGALDKTADAADRSESKFMGLSDVASGLGDLFGIEALGPVAALGLGMADLTGGFAQLAPVMTGAIDKIKNLSIVTKLQAVAQGALNLIMSMNPIFLVVIAVVALIAVFVLAYTKIEWFRDLVDGAFRLIKGVITAVVDWVKENWPLLLAILTGPIGLAVKAIIDHWDTIKAAFTKVKEWISARIDDIAGFFTGLPGRLSAVASDAFDFVKTKMTEASLWIAEKVGDIVGYIKGLPGKISAGAGEIFGFVKTKMTEASLWIAEKVGDIVGFFTGIPGRIAAVTGGMWDGIKIAFRSAVNAIVDFWNGLEFRIPGFKVGPIGFDAFTLGVPDIPRMGLARGGHASGGQAYIVGELGPELFVPGASGTVVPNGAGGGTIINNYIQALDPAGAATAVVRALDEYESRNGARYARA